MQKRQKIAVFASGSGTNFQALLDACQGGYIHGDVVLLVSGKPNAAVLDRARKAGVASVVLPYEETDTYAQALLGECRDRAVDLVCLAGHMTRIPTRFLDAFPQRVLNVHPALLPAFGGKGMYGAHVHEAVLQSGARVSGATVHFVDEKYDNGPAILQQVVPVMDGDTPETLAERVHQAEHAAYPRAVRLWCEGRLTVDGARVVVKPELTRPGHVRRALVSVSNKDGVVDFCRGLAQLGIEIVSTGGTARALREAGLWVRPVEALTGHPEMLDGRVKTLHPRVHAGLLFRRDSADHVSQMARLDMESIDLVVVNLYPFAAAAQKHAAFEPALMEEIDIGGPTLVRASAKNCDSVVIVVDPSDYTEVLSELDAGGVVAPATRRELARKAFAHTAAYDAMISRTLSGESGAAAQFPEVMEVRLRRVQTLRYGENPHQAGALYRQQETSHTLEQLHGKELSYNNILDAEGAWDLAQDFAEPAVAIFKHVTPCGAATGKALLDAWKKALACDPVCAFGGIVATNRTFDPDTAAAIGDLFLEVIVAPDFHPAALEILWKKKNLRLLKRTGPRAPALQFRSAGHEVLVQQPDGKLWEDPRHPWRVVSARAPTADEEAALRFAWPVCKHVRSNAIVVAGPTQVVGLGTGQMSRVDSVHIAGVKMEQFFKDNPRPSVLAGASDAFFPFRDGLDALVKLGVTAVVHPGGSVRDAEVIAAADEHKVALVVTGMRHFRH
ncbi:MAG: bifunctional phosphoribosylaminoimidazolecarboxamide formyltransferase/IMP cyclohydrolase [Deltaproteobacteria bacterium]|nr:bifunctional phosphoribosylaminoimidazolecarboxamide formyltransferase/IMP cyclohydrolase [Deltaproteobacteria bacterium]